MRFIAFITALAISSLPLPARAQDRVGITFQGGVVTGDDAAPLDNFARPLITASIQRVFKRHFVIEGEVSYWTLHRVIERGPHNVEGPQGVIGTVTGSRVEDSHSFCNYGVNALIKSTGRIRVFGGGGAGFSTDHNVYAQQSFGCSPSLDPRTCDRFELDRGRGPVVILRGLGGIEAPITNRVELVGTLRAETTAWEDRSDWLSAAAGVRFSFD